MFKQLQHTTQRSLVRVHHLQSTNRIQYLHHFNTSSAFHTNTFVNGAPKRKTTIGKTQPTLPAAEKEGIVDIVDLRKKRETLPGTEVTNEKFEVFQQSIDKLAKKYDSLAKSVASLQETVAIMSASIQMLTDNQITQRVRNALKAFKLIQDSDAKHSPFIKVNSLQRIESYLTSFISGANLPGAEQAIKDSAAKQMFVGMDGLPFAYQHAAASSSSWITALLNASRGGRNKSMISGEVTMIGSMSNITRALHRAIRYPALVKRYTLRVHKALFKSTNEQALQESPEHVTLFVYMGTLFASSISPKFVNRILTYRDINRLEDEILDSFDGEVYLPSDEEIVQSMFSDPVKDPVGVWSILLQSQLNGKTLAQLPEEDVGAFAESDRDKFMLLILLRLMVIYRFDLFLGVSTNPLP